jgi:lysophospholipase L1-like esterase
MKRLLIAFAAAGAMLLAAVASTALAADSSKDVYYVSLGDSLAAGEQPVGNLTQGYADQLFKAVRSELPGLRLAKLGCGGESTATFIDGGVCPFSAGSQLDQAVDFLESHGGQVEFITLTIGANDALETCMDFETGVLDISCVGASLPAIQANLTTILQTLHAAAPGVPVYGMTYYSPFLSYWVLGPGGAPGDPALALNDEQALEALNAGLLATYGANGVVVADVAGAFDIGNFTDLVQLKGVGLVPVNVANACAWTWYCTVPPHGPDVHATSAGYRVIARAFADVLNL